MGQGVGGLGPSVGRVEQHRTKIEHFDNFTSGIIPLSWGVEFFELHVTSEKKQSSEIQIHGQNYLY